MNKAHKRVLLLAYIAGIENQSQVLEWSELRLSVKINRIRSFLTWLKEIEDKKWRMMGDDWNSLPSYRYKNEILIPKGPVREPDHFQMIGRGHRVSNVMIIGAGQSQKDLEIAYKYYLHRKVVKDTLLTNCVSDNPLLMLDFVDLPEISSYAKYKESIQGHDHDNGITVMGSIKDMPMMITYNRIPDAMQRPVFKRRLDDDRPWNRKGHKFPKH